MVKQSAQTFSSALFDFTFRSFVTPKIIQLIYIVAIVFAVIDSCVVFFICTSFRSVLSGYGGYGGGEGGGSVLLGMIVSPIFFIIQLIAARVILEAAIALIRIAENTDPSRRREASER